MAYSSLQQFIETLEAAGELLRIHEPVSPLLEIAEITDRVSKAEGKALLFVNNGTPFPVLINAMGSDRRMCLALGVDDYSEIGARMEQLLKEVSKPKETVFQKLSVLPQLSEVASWMPRLKKGKGSCQEVTYFEPNIFDFPVLKCWPHDGGQFITLPAVHTQHPETKLRNVGMYRVQLFEKNLISLHWHLHKGSASHYREYQRLGIQKMPVAIALGGDPVLTYVASAPLPENIDEYLLAGFLRNQRVDLVKCLTHELQVPAEADIIIEGYVDTTEDLIWEGPFGDHTGFYSLADYYPKMHITCITHKKDAVYPATIVGIPPQEDAYLGKATEKIFLTPIRLSMIPELVDLHMPVEGAFHNMVIAKIRKTYAGQAQKVMHSLWGAGQMMFSKMLVIVNEDVDITDYHQVLQRVCETVTPDDLVFSRGPADVLDHSGKKFVESGKIGIDATRKPDQPLKTEYSFPSLDLPGNQAIAFAKILPGFPVLFAGIDKSQHARSIHEELCQNDRIRNFKFICYLDGETEPLSFADWAWLMAGNTDPGRDCFLFQNGFPLGIDGTRKMKTTDGFARQWPNVVTMNTETIQKIDQIWEKLHLGNLIPSPSLKYQALVKKDGAVFEE